MASRHLLATALRASTSTSASASASPLARRALSTSLSRNAISNFAMPAMSPTMTSGGVGAWKVKEGDSFSAGDVLLEIETDKATMDVEAQDDGVLAKILVQEGAKDVQVGKTIAVLAEEGDDISNVEVPKEEEQQQPSQQAEPSAGSKDQQTGQEAKSAPDPSSQAGASTASSPSSSSSSSHAQSSRGPMFPSVQRLIAENHIDDAESKIKGTGIRGMITKGDVLAFLGKAKSPTGTFKEPKGGIAVLGPSQAAPKGGAASGGAKAEANKANEPLSSSEVRSLILGGLAASSSARKARSVPVAAPSPLPVAQQALDHAIQGYESTTPVASKKTPVTRKDGIRTDDVLWDLI